MSNMMIGWNNAIDAETGPGTLSTPLANSSYPVTNAGMAIDGDLSDPFRKPVSSNKTLLIYADLGADYVNSPARVASLHGLENHTALSRWRVRASNRPMPAPAFYLDFMGTLVQGRTYPNTIDSRITFSRASGGMFWRDRTLFGQEDVDLSSGIALTTSETTWTVAAGGKWETGDLVYVLPRDGTANISLTATVASYAGTTLVLENITAGSDTTTTKTEFKIVYRGPRLDFHPLTNKRRGLLMGGSATNLATNSRDVSNAAWSKTRVSPSSNVAIAPDGTLTADKIVSDGQNGAHYASKSTTVTSGTQYVRSIYLEPAGETVNFMSFPSSEFPASATATFDLTTGTVASEGAGIDAAYIERLPNGCCRCEIVATATGSGTGSHIVSGLRGLASYNGDIGQGFNIWQDQFEAGARATAPIFTEGSAVTVEADLASDTTITDWHEQGAGTFRVAFTPLTGASLQQGIVALSDGTTNNEIRLSIDGSANIVVDVRKGGVSQAQIDTGVDAAAGKRCVAAFRWAGDDFAVSVNGRDVVTDSDGAVPYVDQLILGAIGDQTAPFYGWIEDVAYWAKGISNAGLKATSNVGATINTNFAGCSVDLPLEYTFSRASGATYIDEFGLLAGYSPSVTTPIVPTTTGKEIVKNGGFDSDALFVKGTGWSIGSGLATKSAGTASDLTQDEPTIPGQVCRVRVRGTGISAGSLNVKLGGVTVISGITADGDYTGTVTASADLSELACEADAAFVGSIDNLSLTLEYLRVPVRRPSQFKVGQLLRMDPQEGTANTYMLGKVLTVGSSYVDIDVTEAAAPELISNGHFTTNTSGWTGTSASLSVVSGKLRVTASASPGFAYQAETVTSGYNYALDADVDASAASSAAAVDLRNGATGAGTQLATSAVASGAISRVVLASAATSADMSVRLQTDTNTGTVDFDNISLKRAHTDWIVSLAGPRFTHETDGTALGYLPEDTATNLITDSETLSTGGVTVTNVEHTLSFYGPGTVTLSGTSTAGPLVGTGANERVSLTFTPSAGTLTLTVSGSATQAQLETGDKATSYIPNFGVSRTRAADVCTIDGENAAARIRQDEGAVVLDYGRSTSATGTDVPLSITDGTANERIALWDQVTNTRLRVSDGGATQADVTDVKTAGGARVAFGYKASDFALSNDGGSEETDSAGTLPTVNVINIGADSAGNAYTGTIARLIYWPERDPVEDLSTISASSADLDAYTIPGTIGDVSSPDLDSSWLVGRKDYGSGSLPEGCSELFWHDFGSEKTYQHWSIETYSHPGPDTDPGTTDDGVALGVSYGGLMKGFQPDRNPSYRVVRGRRSNSVAQKSLGNAKFVDRRQSQRTWALQWEYLTEADSETMDDVVAFSDTGRPILVILDPEETVDFIRTDFLAQIERMPPGAEYTTFQRFGHTLSAEEIVA